MSRSDKYKTKFSALVFRFLFILILIGTLFYIYARYIDTTFLRVSENKIINSKVEGKFDGLKLVHFTDIHYGLTIKEKELKSIVNEINLINPDIVVFTGDLIDKNEELNDEKIKFISSQLNNIKSKYGKYAIKGNHDYSSDYFEKIIQNSEFVILEDSNDIIYETDNKKIFIGGTKSSIKEHLNYETLFSGLSDEMYSIILTHEPDNSDELLKYKKVDLILSGHSHGGQIRFPYSKTLFTANGSKKYNDKYYLIGDTNLFISYGLGTTNYPFRTFNSPSINFYRINSK